MAEVTRRKGIPFWLHMHPSAVSPDALRLSNSWCAGGISFFLFCILVATGGLLMWHYRPSADLAYRDVLTLDRNLPYGWLVRNLHRWSSDAMVAVVWIHMGRVVLHGSYKPPRQMNWILGVGMLVATMLLAYTGYVLPWDRLGVAAATIGGNMLASAPLIGSEGPGAALFGATAQSDLRFLLLGGREASGPTLVRFYALHCSWLPTILGLLSMLHFWKVRKDGGFSRPL